MAWEHASINSFGYEHLKDNNQFWALSRMKAEIARLPRWTEDFVITTWPSGVDGLFALRDFLIRDMDGEVLLGATSSWLIVDISTRRPQRVDSFRDRMPICESLRAVNGNAQKIILNNLTQVDEIQHTAKVSDIDVNGHINNTRYVEWAVNAFPKEIYESQRTQEVEVNYLSEGFCNDCFTISSSKNSANEYIVNIKRIADGKDLASVRLSVK